MITERFGLRGLTLVDTQSGRLEHASPLERRVAHLLAGYREYLQQDLHFDDATARRLLTRRGVRRPALSADAVERLIDLALAGRRPQDLAAGRRPAVHA